MFGSVRDRYRRRRVALPGPVKKPTSSSMSNRVLGPNFGASAFGRLALAAGPVHRRAVHDQRAGASVITDRHPPPIRHQRLAVGAKELSQIRGVLAATNKSPRSRRPRPAACMRASAIRTIASRSCARSRNAGSPPSRKRCEIRVANGAPRFPSGREKRIERWCLQQLAIARRRRGNPIRARTSQSRMRSPMATPTRGSPPSGARRCRTADSESENPNRAAPESRTAAMGRSSRARSIRSCELRQDGHRRQILNRFGNAAASVPDEGVFAELPRSLALRSGVRAR